MMQDPEGVIDENLPTVGAILLRKRGRELPQQPYRPVIMLALVYDRKAIALRTYHHDGSLKQSSEKACHQVSIYKLSYTLATGASKGSNDAGETSAIIHVVREKQERILKGLVGKERKKRRERTPENRYSTT